MGPAGLSHRRTHNLLLISKLLNQRDHASPFTLVLDTLEQPAQPLLREYLRRSRLSKTRTIFLSFETHVKPKDVDFFVQCFGEGWRPERMVRDVMDITGRGSERKWGDSIACNDHGSFETERVN
jgi:elongator complex protein 5